jgi:galactokinase
MPSHPRFAASLQAQPLDALVASCIDKSQELFARSDQPVVVVSPYRFNPLGAHIEHQGGAVLARCLDQYTVLCFWQRTDALCSIQSKLLDDKWTQSTFAADELDDQ